MPRKTGGRVLEGGPRRFDLVATVRLWSKALGERTNGVVRGLRTRVPEPWETVYMRLYLPATVQSLHANTTSVTRLSSVQGTAHGVTPALRELATELLAQEAAVDGTEPHQPDDELLEYLAHQFAVGDSLDLIAQEPSVAWQRVVISVDIPEEAVSIVGGQIDGSDDAVAASAVEITQELRDVPIICVHVDESDTSGLIEAALAGDEAAMEALMDEELAWYDVTELTQIPGWPA